MIGIGTNIPTMNDYDANLHSAVINHYSGHINNLFIIF